MQHLKNVWALVQTSILVGDEGPFRDEPKVWVDVIQRRLDGTHVHLVDVSDALAASIRTPDAEDFGPMGKVAFQVTSPGDMDLPKFVIPSEGFYSRAGDLADYGDSDQWEGILQTMELLGVPREDYLRLPVSLALQLAQLAVALAKMKSQAQEAGIPVGFTVGPIYWEVSEGV